jgi:hypothetical protein
MRVDREFWIRTGYVVFAALVTLAATAFRITTIVGVEDSWLFGGGVKASVMFADDYDYLNKSIYYVRGDLAMKGYPFGNTPAGFLYPVVLSPWMFAADPQTRIFTALVVNALLAGIAVFFSTLTVIRLTGRCHPLTPLGLAVFATVFLMSFVVMSENLLFAVLAVLMWQVADFEGTLRSRRRIALLLVMLALAPLTRAPGLAVAPALLLVVWVYRKSSPRRFSLLFSAAVLFVTVAPYLVYSALSPKVSRFGSVASRESIYADTVLDFVKSPENWAAIGRYAWGQFCYVFIATAFWVVPVLIILILQARLRRNEPDAMRWRGFIAFTVTGALGFVAFCLAHLMFKVRRDPDISLLIFGRYDDPAAWLLVVAGLAAIAAVKQPTLLQTAILRFVTPFLLCLAIFTLYGPQKWATVNQTGMAILAQGPPPPEYWVAFAVSVTLVCQVSLTSRFGRVLLLSLFIAFQVATIDKGLEMIRARTRRIARSLEAATWIHENVPTTSRIGFDHSVSHERAPRGYKAMWNVYRAMFFCVYPRPAILVKSEEHLRDCDFFYTTVRAEIPAPMPVAWTNGDYTLYRVPPAQPSAE